MSIVMLWCQIYWVFGTRTIFKIFTLLLLSLLFITSLKANKWFIISNTVECWNSEENLKKVGPGRMCRYSAEETGIGVVLQPFGCSARWVRDIQQNY